MIYPELFGRGKENAIENSSQYAFAIYINKKLVRSYNDYPFATIMPTVNFKGKEWAHIKNYQHDLLWYHAGANTHILIIAGANTHILIIKENRFFIEFLTLFSYLLCSFLLLAAFTWLLTVFISTKFSPIKIKGRLQLSIRNQIHGIVISIVYCRF